MGDHPNPGHPERIERRLQRAAAFLYPDGIDPRAGAGWRVLVALAVVASAVWGVDRAAFGIASALAPLYGATLPSWTLGAVSAVALSIGLVLMKRGVRRGRSLAQAAAIAVAGAALLWTAFPYSAWQVAPTFRVGLGALWLVAASSLLWRITGRTGQNGRPSRWPFVARLAQLFDRVATWRSAWLVGALALFAATAAALISYGAFRGVPVITDGHCYRYLAHALANGRVTNPAPFSPEVNAELIGTVRPALTGGIDALFIQHPPGFAVLLVVGVLSGLVPLVNPILHGLTVVATYRLGVVVQGEGVGRGSAAVLALSPFAAGWAGTHMAHTACALAAVVFALGMFSAKRRGVVWPFVAGLALGAGLAIRPWSMILVAMPFAFAAVGLVLRRPRWFAPRLAVFLAGLAPPLVMWLLYNQAISGSPWTLGYSLLHGDGHDLGFGLRGFGTAHAPFTWWMGLEHTHYRASVMPMLFTCWPAPVFLATLVGLWRTKSRRVRLLWWQFVVLAAGYGFYFNRGDHVADLRFLLDAAPALAVVAVAGLASFTSERATRIRALLLLCGAFVFVSVTGAIEVRRFCAQMMRERTLGDPAIAVVAGEDAVLFLDREVYERCCPISDDPALTRPLVVARASGVIDDDVAARFDGKGVYYVARLPGRRGLVYQEVRRHASLLDQAPPERIAAARFHHRRNRGCVVTQKRPWTVRAEAGKSRAVTFGVLYVGPPEGARLTVRLGDERRLTLRLDRSGDFGARAGFTLLSRLDGGEETVTFELAGAGSVTIVEPRAIDVGGIQPY